MHPMDGRFKPPLYFMYIVLCLNIALNMIYYWYEYQGPWIDRFLVFEMWLATTVTWLVMLFGTPPDQWTRRGLGIFGFMFGASCLTTISQLNEWGVLETPNPQWAVNFYRSPLVVSVVFIMYGYFMWGRKEGWDDQRTRR